MTREEKIIEFLKTSSNRWCTAVCACLGCVNGSELYAWKQQHPNEAPIEKHEFDKLKK